MVSTSIETDGNDEDDSFFEEDDETKDVGLQIASQRRQRILVICLTHPSTWGYPFFVTLQYIQS